ncbi:MAG TPA: Gfo/Idh/MocA family oxidoreductase [Abditibacteriaceae bacterium]|nr:Gfo/Idh/MocA family oxidoreductase [Abditibacteriaceae bacterium]
MIRLALVGGAGSYHGRAFSHLVNGPQQDVPAAWPQYSQRIAGSRIVTVWDEDQNAAAQLAAVFGIERVAHTREETAQDVDGVIITDDGTLRHQERASFFIERGIPTFIDKPLSNNIAEAEEILSLAARHSTPVMSCSALRFAAETAALRAAPQQLGRIEMATTVCTGDLHYYGIHALELAYSILGPGIRSVHNVGEPDHNIIKLTYRDGRTLMLLVSTKISYLFQLNLYGSEGWRQIVVTDSGAFYSNMLRAVVAMCQTRQSPVPAAETLEIIQALVLARASLETGQELLMADFQS